MENWKKALLAGTALIGTGLLVPAAEAQQRSAAGATGVAQTPQHTEGAQVTSATAAICTATQSSAANLTLTMTPNPGESVYISQFSVSVIPNATGSNSTAAYTSTNLPNSPAWLIGEVSNAAALPELSMIQVNDVYPTGLKASAPGVVTLLPNATLASASVCPRAIWWSAP